MIPPKVGKVLYRADTYMMQLERAPKMGHVLYPLGLLFNWRRHPLSLPKFTSSLHNKLPTNCEESIMLSA